MFSQIIIENSVANHPITQKLNDKFSSVRKVYIDDHRKFWGRVKKPYLEKRENLNLYIAHKEGTLIKKAPDAYGTASGEHYYFIHAYNCIYECEYCYLQGHFNSPDLVLFVNHEDIIKQMSELALTQREIWFHAGEFSDSLALSHLTGEIEQYHQFLVEHPNAYIELRTKSANTQVIEKLEPINNLITTFSLSPDNIAKAIDRKTPSTKARLAAMNRLTKLGHPMGIHFDPIIYQEDFEAQYLELIKQIQENVDINLVRYISLGVVRFTKDVYYQFSQNYPDSKLHRSEMIKSFDGKVRYPRPIRMWMMNKIKSLLIEAGLESSKIYLCMEEDE